MLKVQVFQPWFTQFYILDTPDQVHNRRINRIGGSMRGFLRHNAIKLPLEEMQSLIPSLMIEQINDCMDRMLTRKDK